MENLQIFHTSNHLTGEEMELTEINIEDDIGDSETVCDADLLTQVKYSLRSRQIP